MDFSYGNSGINNSIIGSSVGNSVSTNAAVSNAPSDAAGSIPMDIMKAKPGMAFEGEIANIQGKDVTILLENGQSLNARLEADVDIFMGQKLSFLIKENNGSTIEIKPLYDTLSQNPAVLKAIKESGIENNTKNINMVLAMVKEGMSIDKQSLAKMLRLINANPQADISTIVKMNKLGIPVNENNITQFKNYQNCEHRLIKDMGSLSEQIPKMLEEILNSGDTNKALAFNNKIVDILKGLTFNAEINTDNENFGKNIIIDEQGNKSYTSPNTGNVNENIDFEEGKAVNNKLFNENVDITKEPVKVNGENISRQDKLVTNNKNGEVLPNQITEKQLLDKNGNAVLKDAENIALPKENSIENVLTREQRLVMAAKMEEFGIEKSVLEAIKNGKFETKELLNFIKDNIINKSLGQNSSVLAEEKVSEFISSKEYMTLLKENVKSEWLLKPSDFGKSEDLNEYYNKLNSQTRELMAAFESFGKGDSKGYKDASNMRSNLEFMNQLNQNYTYMQLPIQFTNENAHSDLYVYTNKKNLKNYDGNVSVMLHLDMEVLGNTDIYLEMTPGKKVKAKFTLDNEKSIDIVEKNMNMLIRALEKKGYTLNVNIDKLEKEPDFVEDFLEKDKVMTSMKRFSFDVRM